MNFLFSTVSRSVLGPTQPPTQWAPGAFSSGIKWPEREADHSRPTSVEVKKKREFIHPLSHMPSLRSVLLVKQIDKFTLFTLGNMPSSVGSIDRKHIRENGSPKSAWLFYKCRRTGC
jgi:hypothetical protein